MTGHRPNRLLLPEAKLQARVRTILESLLKVAGKSTARNKAVLDIISPLAEGSDCIVAREALALRQQLSVIIPFARRDYEKTFSTPDATAEFRALWKASAQRINLHGNPKRSAAAYLAAGNVTLSRADVILTIWDGKPAAGRGGTPEVLQNALDFGVPIIWVHAAKDIDARMLLSPARGDRLLALTRRRQKVSFSKWVRTATVAHLSGQ